MHIQYAAVVLVPCFKNIIVLRLLSRVAVLPERNSYGAVEILEWFNWDVHMICPFIIEEVIPISADHTRIEPGVIGAKRIFIQVFMVFKRDINNER